MDDARRAKALETIERNARLQQKIVEDLLDVSRIIAGQLRLEKEPMPFRPVVESAVDSIRPLAAAKSIAADRGARRRSGDPHRRSRAAAAGYLESAVERDQVHA